MYKIPVRNEEKISQQFLAQQPKVNTSTSTGFGSYANQVFKGIAGLCGLSAFGGLVYWARGLFGSKVNDAEKNSIKVLDKADNSLVEGLSSLSLSARVTYPEKLFGDKTNQKSTTISAGHAYDNTNSVGVLQTKSNVFSANDLEYREKKSKLEIRRKLASSPASCNFTYLPSVKLADISNGWGVKFNAEETDYGGIQISSAGDINGDGIDDLVIGAPNASPYGLTLSGTTYVVFGKKGNWVGPIELSFLNGTTGFKLNGEAENDESGTSVSRAGDINGDGIDDLVIGAPNASPYGLALSGTTYVVFGKKTPWSSPFNLSSLNGKNGIKIYGENGKYCCDIPRCNTCGDRSGASISAAGDINGDGIDDLVIGAPWWTPPNMYHWVGATYVVFGKKTPWSSPFNLTTLSGNNGFKIYGEVDATTEIYSSEFGSSVSGAGDINGDGIDDLVVGTPKANLPGLRKSGISYVIFGKNGPWAKSFNLTVLDGTNGFKICGTGSFDGTGYSVSGAGDINGDGIDDLVIGSKPGDFVDNEDPGSVYVVFGKKSAWSDMMLFLDGKDGFKLNGEGSNWGVSSVSGVGDINGDGIDDLVIGNSNTGVGVGTSYVVFGKNTRWTSSTDLSSLNGINGFKLNGEISSDYSGTSVSRAGDFNGDGIADLAIGALGYYDGSYAISKSYVVFGGKSCITNNTLAIYQGQSIIINNAILASTNKASIFKITNNQHGYFSLITQGSLPIYIFTANQIAARVIKFTHDNSQSAPSYQVSLNSESGLAEIYPQEAIIKFAASPILTKNHLTIYQGQKVLITNMTLSASAIGSNPSTLLFIMNNVSYGSFALLPNIKTTVTHFLQGAIANNTVVFIDDNSPVAPSYSISISDGTTTVGPTSAIVTFCTYPVLIKNFLTINQGQTITITSNILSATDNCVDTNTLNFTVTNIQHGHFELNAVPPISITTFMQSQIASNLIKFIHDGTQLSPYYQVSVSNGILSTLPVNATIDFDATPQLVHNSLVICQGQTVTITNNILSATDLSVDSGILVFTVFNPQRGAFYFRSNPSVAINTFRQSNITTQSIIFKHDGSNNAPAYSIAVSDGRITIEPSPAIIVFEPYNPDTSSNALRNFLYIGLPIIGVSAAIVIFMLIRKHRQVNVIINNPNQNTFQSVITSDSNSSVPLLMDEHKNSLPKNPNSFFNKIHINMGDTSTTTTNNINASRVDASNNSGSIGAIDSSQTIQENAKVRLI